MRVPFDNLPSPCRHLKQVLTEGGRYSALDSHVLSWPKEQQNEEGDKVKFWCWQKEQERKD